MSLRIPLVATVIGALFIGGAVTGTTLALWHDQATLGASQIASGEMTVTVKDAPEETSITLGAISNLVPGGQPMTVEGIIRNTSPTAAKNLELDVKVAGLAVAPSPTASTGFILGNLKIDVRRKPAAGCPTLTAGDLTDASGSFTTGNLNATVMNVSNRTVPICVSIAAKSTMPNSATGTLDLTFQGVQAP